MNIVLVSAFFRPHVGGVEVYTEQVARELAARGHRVLVLTSLLPGQDAHFEQAAEGYTIVRLDAGFLMDGRFPFVRVTPMNRFALEAVLGFAPQAVVIGARFYPICVLGAYLAQRAGCVPLVVEHVSAYLTVNNPLADAALHAYEHGMAALLRRFPAAFYGVSKASAAWLGTFGIRARGVLGNAIDAQRFVDASNGRPFREELGVQPGQTLAVFAGRLTPEKGVRVLIAAAEAMQAWPGVRFALAGEGPLEAEVRAAAKRLPNLSFVGKLDAPTLSAFMQAADVLCLPSRSEGMPTALLEAGAAGAAVALPQVGGVEELVPDARFGVVLPDRSAEELAGAILFLHENPEARRSMADHLHDSVATRFSWSTTVDALLQAAEQANPKGRSKWAVKGRMPGAEQMGDAEGAEDTEGTEQMAPFPEERPSIDAPAEKDSICSVPSGSGMSGQKGRA